MSEERYMRSLFADALRGDRWAAGKLHNLLLTHCEQIRIARNFLQRRKYEIKQRRKHNGLTQSEIRKAKTRLVNGPRNEVICFLHDKGLPVSKIGEHVGVSHTRAHQILWRAGKVKYKGRYVWSQPLCVPG